MAITNIWGVPLRSAVLRLAAAGLVALACSSGPARAETEKLTEASVRKFIASYPEVKTIAVNQASAKGKKIGGAANPLLAVVEAASDDQIKGQIDVTARRHGFRDSKEWFGVARSVGVAYAHMKAGADADGKAQKKLEKALAKIDDMDFLSDKQKKKLKDAARDSAGVVLEPPPPENIAVVKAMAPQIEATVK
jgi:hypothetical protein